MREEEHVWRKKEFVMKKERRALKMEILLVKKANYCK